MPQWFLRFSEFPEFREFNESSAPVRENPNVYKGYLFAIIASNEQYLHNIVFDEKNTFWLKW